MNIKKLLLTIIIFSLIIVTVCKGFTAVKDKNAVYVHMSAEPGTLNPVLSTDAYASKINSYIMETLIDTDKDSLEMVPMLAERWKVSGNKLEFTFYLKKNVKWSDGHDFTADDVVYSFNLLKNPKIAAAHLKVYVLNVKKIIKLNQYSVKFICKEKNFLTLKYCGQTPIVPRHIFNDGTDFNTHKKNRSPIGTGPYKLEKWETSKKIVLTRNDLYREKHPQINRIIYKYVAEPNVALQMLKKGELDVMSIRPIQWKRQTNSEKFKNNFYKLKYYLPGYSFVAWNLNNPLLKEVKVRRALTHLTNRKAILEKLNYGLGVITTGNFFVFGNDYNKEIKSYPYDIEKAKQLLKEAGWKDSDKNGVLDKDNKEFKFTLTIPSGAKSSERFATIIKEDFEKAGIIVDIQKFEWTVFVTKLHKRDFDAVKLGWSMGYDADPYQVWHSSQFKNGSNFIGFSNTEADKIIIAARSEFNQKKRNKLFHRFHEILHAEQPYTFLFCIPALVVVNKRFKNVIVHKTGLDIKEWAL